jgi:hypothetical protein
LLGKKVALGLVVGRNFDFFKKDLEDIKDRVGTFLPCNNHSYVNYSSYCSLGAALVVYYVQGT